MIPTLEQNIAVGKEIRRKVRATILAGGTDLRNNDYRPEESQTLDEAVRAIRRHITNITKEGKGLFYDMRSKLLGALPRMMERFHLEVYFSEKYALANCYEYTGRGLHYLTTNEQYAGYSAEWYRIARGDHSLMVMGRDPGPNSDRADPATWGENAVIVDIWTEEEDASVYPVTEIRSKLKDFFRDYFASRITNRLTPFDPLWQRLAPRAEGPSTAQIRMFNDFVRQSLPLFLDTIESIREGFKNEISLLQRLLLNPDYPVWRYAAIKNVINILIEKYVKMGETQVRVQRCLDKLMNHAQPIHPDVLSYSPRADLDNALLATAAEKQSLSSYYGWNQGIARSGDLGQGGIVVQAKQKFERTLDELSQTCLSEWSKRTWPGSVYETVEGRFTTDVSDDSSGSLNGPYLYCAQ